MFELSGKIANVSFDYFTGKPLVTLSLNEGEGARAMIDQLRECELLTVTVDKFREKRSLDANAYAWLLIGRIAAKTNVPKNEVYQNFIREMGGNYEIVCCRKQAVQSLCDKWQRNGIGWVTEVIPSKLRGCENVFLYYGSSVFDTKEMSRLIDLITQDCMALGIELKPQEEINSLLREWGK